MVCASIENRRLLDRPLFAGDDISLKHLMLNEPLARARLHQIVGWFVGGFLDRLVMYFV